MPAAREHHIVEYTVGPAFEATSDDRYTRLQTALAGANFSMTFVDGGALSAGLNNDFERLESTFQVPASQLTVAPGDYRFNVGSVRYGSSEANRVSGSLELVEGGYWTGTQRTFNTGVRFRLNEHLAARGTFGHNVIDLPHGRFTGTLLGMRLDTSFNPRMFLNAFIQHTGRRRRG